jgi:hypothetical protein
MPAARTHFSCGHLGKGTYCHRCKQAKDIEDKRPANVADDRFQKMTDEANRLRAQGK